MSRFFREIFRHDEEKGNGEERDDEPRWFGVRLVKLDEWSSHGAGVTCQVAVTSPLHVAKLLDAVTSRPEAYLFASDVVVGASLGDVTAACRVTCQGGSSCVGDVELVCRLADRYDHVIVRHDDDDDDDGLNASLDVDEEFLLTRM